MYHSLHISVCNQEDQASWDQYVSTHPHGSLYHCYKWKTVFEKAYRHNTQYLAARHYQGESTNYPGEIVGILPLVHIKSQFFGNSIVSLPYFDTAGVLGNNLGVVQELIAHASQNARQQNVDRLEIRCEHPLRYLISKPENDDGSSNLIERLDDHFHLNQQKVLMLLQLPDDPDILFKSFRSKLRSQIRKPIKEGITSTIGGRELFDQFYRIFSTNMRDLGSPVHSRKFIRNTIEQFTGQAKIVLVGKNDIPMAAGVIIRAKNRMENPWASSLRIFSKQAPNMLLYWSMLEYACSQGATSFNFGRSSLGSGTFKFKEQWGAQPSPTYWYRQNFNPDRQEGSLEIKDRHSRLIALWQKLPLSLANLIGPVVRKGISL